MNLTEFVPMVETTVINECVLKMETLSAYCDSISNNFAGLFLILVIINVVMLWNKEGDQGLTLMLLGVNTVIMSFYLIFYVLQVMG